MWGGFTRGGGLGGLAPGWYVVASFRAQEDGSKLARQVEFTIGEPTVAGDAGIRLCVFSSFASWRA